MDRYIGVDVHATSCTVAVVGPSGRKLGSHVVIGLGEETRNFSEEDLVGFGCLSRLAGLAAERIGHEQAPRTIGGEVETRAVIETVIDTLNEIAWVVGSALELEEILAKIVAVIVKVTGGDACFLYLYDEDKNELRLRASNTAEPNVMDKVKMKFGCLQPKTKRAIFCQADNLSQVRLPPV